MGDDSQVLIVVKSLHDQMKTMNDANKTLISQGYEYSERVEKKVDETNLKIDNLRAESQEMVKAVSLLSLEMRNNQEVFRTEIENRVEQVEGDVLDMKEDFCGSEERKFCKEMTKKKDKIEELIKNQEKKDKTVDTIKNESLKKIVTVVVGALFFIGFTIFVKWDDIVKLFKP